MKTIDIRLNENERQALHALIGTEFTSMQHDEFTFVNSSTEVVAFDFYGKHYYLYSFTEPMDYYGADEDIAVWTFEEKRYPIVDDKHFICTPVKAIINGVSIVQENQRVYKEGEQIYNVWLTRGIIFDLGDHQISFEKAVWFSEEIYIQRGNDLIKRFTPTEEFCKADNWGSGMTAECTRTIEFL